MSRRAEVHNRTIPGIGIEARYTLEELLKLKRTMQWRESDVGHPAKGA